MCTQGIGGWPRFQLHVPYGSRIVLRVPIPAEIEARVAPALPQSNDPGALAPPKSEWKLVPRIARGSNTWKLAIPEPATPRALFVQIKSSATTDRRPRPR
jgi:hypothetical protein